MGQIKPFHELMEVTAPQNMLLGFASASAICIVLACEKHTNDLDKGVVGLLGEMEKI